MIKAPYISLHICLYLVISVNISKTGASIQAWIGWRSWHVLKKKGHKNWFFCHFERVNVKPLELDLESNVELNAHTHWRREMSEFQSFVMHSRFNQLLWAYSKITANIFIWVVRNFLKNLILPQMVSKYNTWVIKSIIGFSLKFQTPF